MTLARDDNYLPVLLRISGPPGCAGISRCVMVIAVSVGHTTRVMRFIFDSDLLKTHRRLRRSTCRGSTRSDSWGRQPVSHVTVSKSAKVPFRT